jgi:hypothetical protein
VLQVNASLDNLLPFDYLSYSFQSEVNNFVIGQATGIIQVSSAAVFNAAANNLYELTVSIVVIMACICLIDNKNEHCVLKGFDRYERNTCLGHPSLRV